MRHTYDVTNQLKNTKYIVDYTFLFLLVQEVLLFVKKNTEVMAKNKVARYLWPTV